MVMPSIHASLAWITKVAGLTNELSIQQKLYADEKYGFKIENHEIYDFKIVQTQMRDLLISIVFGNKTIAPCLSVTLPCVYLFATKKHFRRAAKVQIFIIEIHSRPMRNQIKLKETLTGPAQGEWVCHKDSKYILIEILANRTWKGCASSCQPSQPNCQIGLAWTAGASTALSCPIF